MSATPPPYKTNERPPRQGDRSQDAPRSAYVAPKVTRDARPEAGAGGETARKAVRKQVRVRKARRSGTCPACRRHVLVGDLIASVGGEPFMCISHVSREDTG